MAQSSSSSLGDFLAILICKTLYLFYREVHIKWKNEGLVSLLLIDCFISINLNSPDRL